MNALMLQDEVLYEPPDEVPADWDYRYKFPDEMPIRHRAIMTYACCLMDPEAIADATGYPLKFVLSVMNHPPNRWKIDRIQALEQYQNQMQRMEQRKLIRTGLERCEKVMNDPDAPFPDWMTVFKEMADRDPDGHMSKRTKTETTHTHVVKSEGMLRGLIESAEEAKRALERDRAKAIDVTASSTEEDSP